jgi:uncharacterized protein YjbJ (UPF0337 family)
MAMRLGTIDTNKLRGITDKGLGLGKEFVGVLTSNDRLQKEGQAQQERAAAELDALREELKAQKHEAKAGVFEAKQRTAQEAKGGDSTDLKAKDESGFAASVKGKVKEAVGDLTDNAELKQEGQAQKEKGKEETNADAARVKAKAHEAKAKEKELEQRLAQS